MNRRSLGSANEARAADFLTSRGFEILRRNYRVRTGEIDLIARDPVSVPGKSYVVFVEVKFRSDMRGGGPLMAVTFKKQQTICRVARFYLVRHGYPEDTPCRFDVIGITPDGIRHIENAFSFHI